MKQLAKAIIALPAWEAVHYVYGKHPAVWWKWCLKTDKEREEWAAQLAGILLEIEDNERRYSKTLSNLSWRIHGSESLKTSQ